MLLSEKSKESLQSSYLDTQDRRKEKCRSASPVRTGETDRRYVSRLYAFGLAGVVVIRSGDDDRRHDTDHSRPTDDGA